MLQLQWPHTETPTHQDCEGNPLWLEWDYCTMSQAWGWVDLGNNRLLFDADYIAKWGVGVYEHVWDYADAIDANPRKLEKCNSNLRRLVQDLCGHSQSDLLQALKEVGLDNAEDLINEILFSQM